MRRTGAGAAANGAGRAPTLTPAQARSAPRWPRFLRAQHPAHPARSARIGLAAMAVSIALTLTVAALGPSVMEPPLPGRPGQPPWAFAAHPSGYLVVALTAAALILGACGLAVTMLAARRGWSPSPRLILLAGIAAAAALALLPPFGSSDHLSYAAYGRMLVTGHNPYLTGPNALARLGDPVARAVEDWKTSPSVYGIVATGGQGLASLIGGTSVRLTVFVLSLLNLIGFAGTGLLLHRMAAGDTGRQLRAALLWTGNPLLLAVLVAGQHVDSQAIFFGVAAIAVFSWLLRTGRAARSGWWYAMAGAAVGVLAGLGFAVKLSMVLVAAGLAAACVLTRPLRGEAPPESGDPARDEAAPRGWRAVRGWVTSRRAGLAALAGLVSGFGGVTAAALAIGGLDSVRPALRAGSYVSIGTPWRWVRSLLKIATGEGAADNIVKVAAVVTILALVLVLLRGLPGRQSLSGWPGPAGPAASGAAIVSAEVAGRAALAFALAWLTAGTYVLPWYDGLAWALIALLPASAIDWLVLASTVSLAIGYLPARSITMPAGLGWLRSGIRTGVTPALLLVIAVLLVLTLRGLRAGRAVDDANRAVPARSAV